MKDNGIVDVEGRWGKILVELVIIVEMVGTGTGDRPTEVQLTGFKVRHQDEQVSAGEITAARFSIINLFPQIQSLN